MNMEADEEWDTAKTCVADEFKAESKAEAYGYTDKEINSIINSQAKEIADLKAELQKAKGDLSKFQLGVLENFIPRARVQEVFNNFQNRNTEVMLESGCVNQARIVKVILNDLLKELLLAKGEKP